MEKITYQNVMHCDKCNDSGLVMYRDEDGCVIGERCKCHNQRLALITLEKSGLKESVAKFRFDNFVHEETYQNDMYYTCKKFIEQDEKKFLYISGQPGSGKTHIGTATSRTLISRGIPTLYVTYLTLMNEFKANVNEDEYSDVLDKYANIEVLYIDDFMKQQPTKSDIGHSFELINLRVINGKTTIITSERSLDEIIDIDEALGGRIKQQCGQFAINVTKKPGRDWRLKGEKEK